jgi:hypothetical protein
MDVRATTGRIGEQADDGKTGAPGRGEILFRTSMKKELDIAKHRSASGGAGGLEIAARSAENAF